MQFQNICGNKDPVWKFKYYSRQTSQDIIKGTENNQYPKTSLFAPTAPAANIAGSPAFAAGAAWWWLCYIWYGKVQQ